MKISWWKRYYWRVLGYALAGAGAGLVLDELINGPFKLELGDHELWGLVMVIAGAVLISRFPKGKDLICKLPIKKKPHGK